MTTMYRIHVLSRQSLQHRICSIQCGCQTLVHVRRVTPHSDTCSPLHRHFTTSGLNSQKFHMRSQLPSSKRVLLKLGSAVITREDECGIALGRLASIIEQVSELQNQGREMIMVTSGAIAFGKQKMRQEMLMSMSVRDTLVKRENSQDNIVVEPRACAAVGQTGLMSLYEAMFSQYGVKTAQVLITKPDFYHESSRRNLCETLNELLKLNIVPILNANDAVEPPPLISNDLEGVISLEDNDSLAARVAVELSADLMIIMSDVNGIYTKPPDMEGSRLLHTFNPKEEGSEVVFGEKSRVGRGGMESKVGAANWALENGVSVVICNGMENKAVLNIVNGKRIGTFFTKDSSEGKPVEDQAIEARIGSRILQSLSAEQRARIIVNLADKLIEHKHNILAANQRDVEKAEKDGLSTPLVSRLILTEEKLQTLSKGLRQIANSSRYTVGRMLKRTKIAIGMELQQITVPIGVLMVIFESRPDALPQVAALAISSANGLLLKGGKEANHSNKILHQLVQESLKPYVPVETISLVSRREDIEDLLQLSDYIDLVIPRGSKELISKIQQQSQGIPVLGHSEGVCHVYVDKEATEEMAVKIIHDAKCDYPAACNAMETLLLHKSLHRTPIYDVILGMLKKEGIKIHAGPRFASKLKFCPATATNMRTEHGSLELTVELVDDVDDAISHINKFGSSHTDVIITQNESTAEHFLKMVDSACVFHNSSTRFADGYRFGLGAEVGISTTRIHARGPVGVEGLLTTKWILRGSGQTVKNFNSGELQFVHESLPLITDNVDEIDDDSAEQTSIESQRHIVNA